MKINIFPLLFHALLFVALIAFTLPVFSSSAYCVNASDITTVPAHPDGDSSSDSLQTQITHDDDCQTQTALSAHLGEAISFLSFANDERVSRDSCSNCHDTPAHWSIAERPTTWQGIPVLLTQRRE